MRRCVVVLLLALACGCVNEVCAAPQVSRILRKNNKLTGHRDGISRTHEPAYKTPKYYPESYPEYGRRYSSPDAGWQQVPHHDAASNSTPSYGVGGPRAARKRRY
ncbi:MAG: hypothetical protein II349_06880 [Akkermansia sp.]|nr:hypothetical protein [Akkermansia sp.]